MANFNFGIECIDEEMAEKLKSYIEGIEIYQDGLDAQEERVSVISKQGLLPELKSFSKAQNTDLYVEVWGEDEEYDDAEENGSLETYEYNVS